MMRAALVLLVVMSWPLSSLAGGALTFKQPIFESIDKTRRVSGDALVGLVYHSETNQEPLSRLSVALRGYTGDLTLYISTADGRYYAKINYAAIDPQADPVDLALPESSRSWLAEGGYTTRNTALLLREVAGKHRSFPVLWNGDRAGTRARAYINTERTSGFVLDYTTRKRLACTALSESALIFDQICSFPSGLFERPFVEIERRDGSRVLSPIKIATYK